MPSRYDIVVYGASGFTGAYVVECLAKSEQFKQLKIAIAGRSLSKLKSTMAEVSNSTGVDLLDVPILIADSRDEQSLVEMAKQAKVIINTVGPYRLYGEAVVKAAVENGASHVDCSGEPAFLEQMQMKYNETAKQNGVYVVGACGWDSIPCDLGVHFLKQHFPGDLNHIETFVQINSGPAGYSFNAGTYQTLILGIANAAKDGLGKIRRSIMPEKVPRSSFKLPHRGKLFKYDSLDRWAVPFPGADKSVVQRSQYFDYTLHGQRPVLVETYFTLSSLFYGLLLMLWMTVFFAMVQFSFTRRLLQKYPDMCSFYMFKESGPSREQLNQASFAYWFFGYGWSNKLSSANEQHTEAPSSKVIARCDGPDAGYIATSACIVSAALTVLKDRDDLPKDGGVYTSAAAFGHSKIYDRLASYGITFRMVDNVESAKI